MDVQGIDVKEEVLITGDSIADDNGTTGAGIVVVKQVDGGFKELVDLTEITQQLSIQLRGLNERLLQGSADGAEVSRYIAIGIGDILRTITKLYKAHDTIPVQPITPATKMLISTLKECDFSMPQLPSSDIVQSISKLALAITSSVAALVMREMESVGRNEPSQLKLRNLTAPQLMHSGSLHGSNGDIARDIPWEAELDASLLRLNDGVDRALNHAKIWSKYLKDIIGYIEKRSALEMEHSKSLHKLANIVRPSLLEETCLPFQVVFCTTMEQDMECLNSLTATAQHLSQKVVEPLNMRRRAHELSRKHLKDSWFKEVKRMSESVGNLKKSQSQYTARSQELERAQETWQRLEGEALNSSGGSQSLRAMDKRKKAHEDMITKAAEAETAYKYCVAEANIRQHDLERTKGVILSQLRDLITRCERTLQSASVFYFSTQSQIQAPWPVHAQTLHNQCANYEPGTMYAQFVQRIPPPSTDYSPHPFTFTPCTPDSVRGSKKWLGETSGGRAHEGQGSELDNQSHSSLEGKSHDSSPDYSPHPMRKPFPADSNVDLHLYHDQIIASHTFKNLQRSTKCYSCNNHAYRNGVVCEECGLSSHKRCLETLSQFCDAKRTMCFGSDLVTYLEHTGSDLPLIMLKCIEALEKKSLDVKGLYRISGVNSKVRQLVLAIEYGALTLDPEGLNDWAVDLNEINPHVISNVLKKYLRMLPDHLLTKELIPHLIACVREPAKKGAAAQGEMVAGIKAVLCRLPPANLAAVKLLFHHLRRVTLVKALNQMCAINLSIILGPTLFGARDGESDVPGSPLESLADTSCHSKISQILVENAEELFGPDAEGDALARRFLRHPTALGPSMPSLDSDSPTTAQTHTDAASAFTICPTPVTTASVGRDRLPIHNHCADTSISPFLPSSPVEAVCSYLDITHDLPFPYSDSPVSYPHHSDQ